MWAFVSLSRLEPWSEPVLTAKTSGSPSSSDRSVRITVSMPGGVSRCCSEEIPTGEPTLQVDSHMKGWPNHQTAGKPWKTDVLNAVLAETHVLSKQDPVSYYKPSGNKKQQSHVATTIGRLPMPQSVSQTPNAVESSAKGVHWIFVVWCSQSPKRVKGYVYPIHSMYTIYAYIDLPNHPN